MANFIRKPSIPTDDGPLQTWARGLMKWVEQFECHDVTGGGKKVANPNGGYSIEVKPSNGGGGGSSENTWL